MISNRPKKCRGWGTPAHSVDPVHDPLRLYKYLGPGGFEVRTWLCDGCGCNLMQDQPQAELAWGYSPTDQERTREVLEFISRFIKRNGYPPSLREIKDGLGLSSISVAKYQVDKLEGLGLLKLAKGARTMVLVDPGPMLAFLIRNSPTAVYNYIKKHGGYHRE